MNIKVIIVNWQRPQDTIECIHSIKENPIPGLGILVIDNGSKDGSVDMIREAFHKEEEKKQKKDPTKGTTLVMLSVATSIDALAVGLSLSMVNISIWFPALIIGIVATTFTGIGLHLGKKIGQTSHLCSYAEALGGIVLVGIGLKILSEHNVFSNVM